jgi:hypothetical protein
VITGLLLLQTDPEEHQIDQHFDHDRMLEKFYLNSKLVSHLRIRKNTMVATKRRSPTSTLVSKDSISGASSALKDLPEKPKEIWSLREAISLLKDQIILALDRGYTYTEVSQMLSSKGVEISPSTLKYYLSSARKEDGSSTKGRRRRTLSMTAETLQNGSDALDSEAGASEEKPKREKAAPKATKSAPKTPAKQPAKAATKPAAKAKTTSTKTTKTTTRKKSAS